MMDIGYGPAPRLRIYTSPRQYVRAATEILTGRSAEGDDVTRLEQRMARDFNVRHAVAMPFARTGIYMTVKSLIRPGQQVIMSPYTIADVVNMVICAGGVPVFADLEWGTCNIDADLIEQLITDKTGAVLVTHFYGLMCNVEKIQAICKRRQIPMIEDAAQAFGAQSKGRFAGTFGDAGIFSFGVYKNVNSFFGGMVVTDRDDLAQKLRAEMARLPMFDLGNYVSKVVAAGVTDVVTHPFVFRNASFWLFRSAFLRGWDSINNRLKIDLNPIRRQSMPQQYLSQMRPLQARLIADQLDGVADQTAARIAAARRYHQGLRDIPELTLPPMRDDNSHIYWYFPVLYPKRHDLVGFAMKHGRDITESYHRNCADLECFSEFAADLPHARATEQSVIYLPTYPRYSPKEIDLTIKVIRDFFGKAG